MPTINNVRKGATPELPPSVTDRADALMYSRAPMFFVGKCYDEMQKLAEDKQERGTSTNTSGLVLVDAVVLYHDKLTSLDGRAKDPINNKGTAATLLPTLYSCRNECYVSCYKG